MVNKETRRGGENGSQAHSRLEKHTFIKADSCSCRSTFARVWRVNLITLPHTGFNDSMIWALLCFSSLLLDSLCVIYFTSTIYSWLVFCSSEAKHTSHIEANQQQGSIRCNRVMVTFPSEECWRWIFFKNNNNSNHTRDLGARLKRSASQWNVWTHQWGEQYHRGPPHLWTQRRRWVSRRVFVWLEFNKISLLMDPSLKNDEIGDRSHMRACLLRHGEPPKLAWSWQAPSMYTTTTTQNPTIQKSSIEFVLIWHKSKHCHGRQMKQW